MGLVTGILYSILTKKSVEKKVWMRRKQRRWYLDLSRYDFSTLIKYFDDGWVWAVHPDWKYST